MALESVCSTSADLVSMAVDTGASIVLVESTCDMGEMKEARDAIPKGTVAVASVTSEPGSAALFETVRKLKDDAGFTGVLIRGISNGSQQVLPSSKRYLLRG